MSKVTFSFYNETLFNGYKANEPGDHSGDYYPAAKVDAKVAELEGEIKRLREALQNLAAAAGAMGYKGMEIALLEALGGGE